MHELSLALEVCRMAEERLAPDQLPLLVRVGIEVGDGSGVEPANLEFCLESLLTAPPFGQARPVISRLPGDTLRLAYLEIDDGSTDD